ncbi:MAG: hypothetical protein IT349_13750 [Candidatus Eisenbacteria bacterium]|nr:hypothetical protein [Candidatus Eisenbacteria bacterium]MCC7143157.1 hypothetical protein [Candidatus Eisenbacteria bacterium]
MFKKESLLLALAMTAGLLTTAGCYTLIRHPVADVSDFREDVLTDASHETGACFTCHETGVVYTPIGSSPTWGPWYPPPWWMEPNPPSGPGSSPSGPDDQVRHGWDRGPGAPRTEPGTAPGVTPTPSDPSGTPAAPVDPVRAEPDRVKNDDKEKEKQKDKDKDRRGWGR